MDQRRPVRSTAQRPARQSGSHIAPVWQGNNGAAIRRTQDVRPAVKQPVQAAPAKPQTVRHIDNVRQVTPKPKVVAPAPAAVPAPVPQPTKPQPVEQHQPQPIHHAPQSHTPALRPETPPASDAPTVSIRITVPDSETMQKLLAWRPTPKQIILAIVIALVFTVGYQMGRHHGMQAPQAAYIHVSSRGNA